MRRSTGRGALLALTIASSTAAGCGSSSDSSSSSGSKTDSGASAKKSFTVGYSLPTGQNPFLNAIEKGAAKTIAAQGGKVVVRDGQLDPNKQVTDIQEFVNDNVDAIIVGPAQVPEAVVPILKRAQAAGIATFAWDFQFDSGTASGGPPKAPVDGQVTGDRLKVGEAMAAQLKKKFSGSTRAIYVGLPFPVTGTDAMFKSFTDSLASKDAGKVVQRVNNAKDNAEGARPLVNGALTRNGKANAVVTYNGASALGAASAIKQGGRGKSVVTYVAQADPEVFPGLKAGSITRVWDLNPVENGIALGKLASAGALKKPDGEWKKSVTVPASPYDQGNVGSWVPWGQRIAKIPSS